MFLCGVGGGGKGERIENVLMCALMCVVQSVICDILTATVFRSASEV